MVETHQYTMLYVCLSTSTVRWYISPHATKILQPLTDVDIMNLKYYTFVKGKFAGVDNVLISATGYTGSGGVEIYFEDKGDDTDIIWNNIFEVGAPQLLFEMRIGNLPLTGSPFYDVTRDGRRFIVSTAVEETAPTPMTVVLNWNAGFKQ